MKTWPLMGLLLVAIIASAQQPRPLDSRAQNTQYSFAVRPGRPPLTIRVEIGSTGKIGDVLVFKEDSSTPFQRLASCEPDLAMELYHGDEQTVLVEHADFNFDGFEDLKLLQFYYPHLGKSIFCVYLWDEKTTRFRYEPEIPMPDPVPHPETKTLTTHDEYMCGTSSDAVYVWLGDKVIKIVEWGLANEGGLAGREKCPWTAWCSKRINGEMRNVVMKSTGCNDTDPEPVACTPPPSSVYSSKAQRQ